MPLYGYVKCQGIGNHSLSNTWATKLANLQIIYRKCDCIWYLKFCISILKRAQWPQRLFGTAQNSLHWKGTLDTISLYTVKSRFNEWPLSPHFDSLNRDFLMRNSILVTWFCTLNRDFTLNRDSLNGDFTVHEYETRMDTYWTVNSLFH